MLTSVSVDAISAVYTALPATLGLQLGMVRQVQNTNKFVQLVQATSNNAASIAINGAVKLTGTAATAPTVDNTSANTDALYGVNDNAGVVIPAASYFWATIKGPCTVLTKTGATAGKFQVGNATNGAVADAAAWAATTSNRLLLMAANASGSDASRAAVIL